MRYVLLMATIVGAATMTCSRQALDRRGALALAAGVSASPAWPRAIADAAITDAAMLASSDQQPALRLADGSLLPLATFGVQIYDDATAYDYTTQALAVGFRSFFTSPEAGNQRGFARAIHDSGVPRESLYIAGSVLSDEATSFRSGQRLTTAACQRSFDDLAAGGVDTLDLLMLERPAAAGCDAIRGQWRALEAQRAGGAATSLGTCNFDVEQLDCLLVGRVSCLPVVNQIGFNLATRMPHALLRQQHAARRVALMAWGPLGGPSALIPRSILDECAAMGKARGLSASQVALAWLAQQDVAFVVHSRRADHLREDLAIFERSTAAAAGRAATPSTQASTLTSIAPPPLLSKEEMAWLERESERAPAYF